MPQNLPKSPLEQFNSDFINQMPEAEIQLQGQSALDEFNRQFFGQNQEQQERQKSFALEDTYEANGQKDASTLAKDARIQNESGVDPSEVALSFPKRAELMRTLGMTPEEFTRRYPRLTRGFIDDSTMLAIAKNDIDKFRKLEDTLREIAPDIDDEGATTGWDSNRMAYEADTKTWLAGSIQGAVGNLGSGLLGAMQFLTESAYETTDARWLRDLSQGIKETQGELKTWADDQFRAGTKDFGTGASWIAGGAQSGFMNVATFSTGLALAALVAATGGTAAPAIALWANLGLMGLTSFGNAYSEGKQQGLSTLAAGGHGLAQGGLEVATEFLPQKFLGDAIGPKAILKNLTPENKKFVQNVMKYTFSDIAGEQVNTVLGGLESWAVLPENQDKTFIDFLAELPEDMAETFVATLIGSGVTVSAGAVISNTLNNVEGTLANRMGRDFIRQNEAVKGMAIIKTIEDIATNAEVANVAPEMLPGLISKAVGDGIETAYLDSQVFYQMPELKAQIVDVAPELANSIDSAVANGQDVEMPVETLVKLIQSETMRDVLYQDVRLKKDGITPRQAQENLMQLGEDAKRVFDESNVAAERRVVLEKIQGDIANQMVAAGYTRNNAQFQGQLWSSFINAMAERVGMDPDALYEKYKPTIRNSNRFGEVPKRITVPKTLPKRTVERQARVRQSGAGTKRATFAPIAVTSEKPVIIQNRDRSRPGLVAQMHKIAASPNYQMVSFSRDFGNGAPVVAYGAVSENQLGREDFAVTAKGESIRVRYAVVEADSVLTSNNVDGTVNPEYNNADASRMRAIAGNGRIAGLQEAFNRNTTAQYVEAMKADAETTGIDASIIDGMKKPILVRIMPPENVTADIGDVSNTSTTAQLSDFQQANNDAERLNFDRISFTEDGAIDESTVIDFIQQMPVSEQDTLITKSGRPTQRAYDRLTYALIAKAYQDDELTQLATESTGEEARNVFKALVAVAPKYVRLLDSEYDLRDVIAGVAHLAIDAQRKGVSLESHIGLSGDLDLGDAPVGRANVADPSTIKVAQEVAKVTRSYKSIQSLFSTIADEAFDEMVQADSNETDMFGGAVTRSREDVVDGATQAYQSANAEGALFQARRVSQKTFADFISNPDNSRFVVPFSVDSYRAEVLESLFDGINLSSAEIQIVEDGLNHTKNRGHNLTLDDWVDVMNLPVTFDSATRGSLGSQHPRALLVRKRADGTNIGAVFDVTNNPNRRDRETRFAVVSGFVGNDSEINDWLRRNALREEKKNGLDPSGEGALYLLKPRVAIDSTTYDTDKLPVGPSSVSNSISQRRGVGNNGEEYLQKDQQEEARGAYDPATRAISLFRSQNMSTFLHESGHAFLDIMIDLASMENAPADLLRDVQTLLDWFGVENIEAWNALDFDAKTDCHEKFARGFESYLRQGKAPSTALGRAFSRFKKWLVSLYKSASELNVDVSPQVKEVMDRMLASEAEITQAQSINRLANLWTQENFPGTPTQWEQYQAISKDGDDVARAQHNAILLAELAFMRNRVAERRAELDRQFNEEYEKARQQATKELNDNPIYQMIRDFQGEENPRKLSTVEVAQIGNDQLQAVGAHGILADDGYSLEPMAQTYGYGEDVVAFVEVIAGTKPFDQAVEDRAREIMGAENEELLTDAQRQESAELAALNDLTLRRVEEEYKVAAANKAKAEVRTAAKEWAADTIDNTVVRLLNQNQYRVQAEKFARVAVQAAAQHNSQAVAEAKRKQLVNLYAQRESLKAKNRVRQTEKLARSIKRSFKKKLRKGQQDQEFMDQVLGLLHGYGLLEGDYKTNRTFAEFKADFEDKQGVPLSMIDESLFTKAGRNYMDLTYAEFSTLRDAIDMLLHQGRRVRTVIREGHREAIEKIVERLDDEIVDTFDATVPTEKNRVKDAVKGYLMDHMKLSNLVRKMVGGRNTSTLHHVILDPLNQAGEREVTMIREAADKLNKLTNEKLGKSSMTAKVKIISGKGAEMLTLSTRLAIALNCGNRQNRERLESEANGMTKGSINAVLSSLTKSELEWVQGVWDLIDSYWPMIAEVERRTNGLPPQKIEAEPFDVVMPDNSVVAMKGGYYPIKYDSGNSIDAARNEMKNYGEGIVKGAFGSATTKQGFAKKRSEGVDRKLDLDLFVIGSHLKEVIHDICFRETLQEINRLARNGDFARLVQDRFGAEYYRHIVDTIMAVATDGSASAMRSALHPALQFLKGNVTFAALSASVTTVFLQPLGILQSIQRIGFSNVLNGYVKLAKQGSLANIEKTCLDKSEFMRNRKFTMNAELNEIGRRLEHRNNRFVRGVDALEKVLFAPMQGFQLWTVDLPTWYGAYQMAWNAGASEEDAVKIADQTVRDAQGSGLISDQSPFQRNHPLLTVFYSYFSSTLNLVADSWNENVRSKRTVGGSLLFVRDLMMLTAVPALVSELVFSLLRGDDWEDREPEDWAKLGVSATVGSVLSMFVGLRDFATILNGYTYTGPIVGRVFNDAGRLGYALAAEDPDASRIFQSSMSLMSNVIKIPATQINRTWKGIEAYMEGESEMPTSVLFGAPKDK